MSSVIDPTHSSTRSSQALQTQLGQRYTLLDSVRDANFLSKSSTDGLGNNISDMGLGVVDNGLFVYTTKFTPSNPTVARPYPVKFFWLGSPAGTTDANDNFAIFMADVNQSAFYPGAPASTWLVNPRLVLSYQQAKNDIVAWFDANYPGGGTNGVGNTGTGNNTAYGTLDGDNSNPGNVSGMNSIDGQFWPLYDYVDNSILLYFSIKTPNANTKSIYCYKITNTEISSPVSSSQFQGGVQMGTLFNDNGQKGVASSHRFSMISPDPLVTNAKVAGQQSAVASYAYGAFDTANPDHARFVQFFALTDIHGSPTNWSNPGNSGAAAGGGGVDMSGQYNPDKLGSIFAVPQGNQTAACYAVIYNATSDRDIRAGSNAVVISAMQIRIAYFHLASRHLAFGDNLSLSTGLGVVGHCRPQLTSLPDGLPKLIYNDFSFDQSLATVYEYFNMDTVRPENQRQIVISEDNFNNPAVLPTFGKKKLSARLFLVTGSGRNPPTNNPQNDPIYAPVMQIGPYEGNYNYSTGAYYLDQNDQGTLVIGTQQPTVALDNTAAPSAYDFKAFEFSAEDLPPYLRISVRAQSSNSITIEGVVILK